VKVNPQPEVNAMDIYLPADFYDLRHELNDWRDQGSSEYQAGTLPKDEAREGCADPNWRTL
jgi:hypothetical protein